MALLNFNHSLNTGRSVHKVSLNSCSLIFEQFLHDLWELDVFYADGELVSSPRSKFTKNYRPGVPEEVITSKTIFFIALNLLIYTLDPVAQNIPYNLMKSSYIR